MEPNNFSNNSSVTPESFLNEMSQAPEPAKGTSQLTDTPSAPGGLLPEPDSFTYSDTDRPDIDSIPEGVDLGEGNTPGGSANANAPAEELISKSEVDELRQFWAETGVDLSDEAIQMICAMIAQAADGTKYAASPEKKKQLIKATVIWMKSIAFTPSPGGTLITAALYAFGPSLLTAFADRTQKKQAEANAPALAAAVASVTSNMQEKPRTDFRIYANGCYMVNRFGEVKPIAEAKERPNFNNPDEIKGIIKVHKGPSKLKTAYPNMASLIDRIYSEAE